jgi:hypothetical protein
MFWRQLRFSSNELTAHSRDLPEFNLRWFCPPAAAKTVSHSKNERERNLLNCQTPLRQQSCGRTSTPLARSVWLVQTGFYFRAFSGAEAPKHLAICPQAEDLTHPVAIAAIGGETLFSNDAALLWFFAG